MTGPSAAAGFRCNSKNDGTYTDKMYEAILLRFAFWSAVICPAPNITERKYSGGLRNVQTAR